MNKIKFTIIAKYWFLPEGIYNILAACLRSFKKYFLWQKLIKETKIVSRNKRFKGLHQGQRCFILGCGPSIQQQNLKLLKGEICISVSNFFVHPDFNLIRPRYHCIGPLHSPFKRQDYERWFKVMGPYMEGTSLFLGYKDRDIVVQNKLFNDDSVYYLDFDDARARFYNKKFELTGCLPSVSSVSVMGLMLAVYFGFSEIFLLGIEHSAFNMEGKYEYRHFYKGKDVFCSGEISNFADLESEFICLESLWKQYKLIRSNAYSKGIKICNAARGGLLDLFPRVEYESLFK